MDNPRPGWTLPNALQLVADGYTPEQAARLSGYHAARLRVLAAERSRTALHPSDDAATVPAAARVLHRR